MVTGRPAGSYRQYAPTGPWTEHAACRGSTALMNGDRDDADEALAVCRTCPVIDACRAWALTTPDPADGLVAGGLTPRQRARVRRGQPAGNHRPGRRPNTAGGAP